MNLVKSFQFFARGAYDFAMNDELLVTEVLQGFNLSPAYLIGGFIFGVFGFYLFRAGRRAVNLRVVYIGVFLMVYPLFVSSTLWVWMIGAGATAAGYYLLRRE